MNFLYIHITILPENKILHPRFESCSITNIFDLFGLFMRVQWQLAWQKRNIYCSKTFHLTTTLHKLVPPRNIHSPLGISVCAVESVTSEKRWFGSHSVFKKNICFCFCFTAFLFSVYTFWLFFKIPHIKCCHAVFFFLSQLSSLSIISQMPIHIDTQGRISFFLMTG